VESGEEDRRPVEQPERRWGFWLVVLLLFGPLVATVVFQFTSDENRYISPTEAKEIALDHYGLEKEPRNVEVTFDEDPPESVDADAVWTVTADDTRQAPCFEVEIDAETGSLLEECVGAN
jgi:hypothetical protein